jgi:hypothetical protein
VKLPLCCPIRMTLSDHSKRRSSNW